LIWTSESLFGPHVLEVLDSNMLAEVIDAGEEFITLFGSSFFVTSAKRAVEGTPQEHLFIWNRETNFDGDTRRLNGLAALTLIQ
jgi:hypothetical protein